MNGLADNLPPRRLSRETRHLLIAALAALVALWVLARLRFPERAATSNPLPPLLSQLSVRPGFAELDAEIARLQERLAPSLVAFAGPGIPSRPLDPRFRNARTALRIRDDIAVALLDSNAEPDIREALAHDRATGLVVVRVPATIRPFVPVPWAAEQLEAPRYVLAALSMPDRVWLQPVVAGALTPTSHPAWNGTVWRMAGADVPAGSVLFTHDGDLLGIVARDEGQSIVVPGELVLSEAERLVARGDVAPFDPGVEVQPLTPRLQAASGAAGGVMVAWVRPDGPWASQLMAGDAIEAIEATALDSVLDWNVRIARLSPDRAVTLTVWRSGQRLTMTMPVAAATPAAASRGLGLTLRHVSRVGSEVVRVEPGSAGADAGLRSGDMILSVAHLRAPSPRDVSDAFVSAEGTRPVLVAIARGDVHLVLALVN